MRLAHNLMCYPATMCEGRKTCTLTPPVLTLYPLSPCTLSLYWQQQHSNHICCQALLKEIQALPNNKCQTILINMESPDANDKLINQQSISDYLNSKTGEGVLQVA